MKVGFFKWSRQLLCGAAAAVLGIVPMKAAAAGEVSVSARSGVLMEAVTGRVIWEQNGEERLPMASTTKILTALLTLEQPGLDEPFTVNADAIRVEGTSMGLTEGAEVTLRTLAAGMLLSSGNDAANAAAVRVAGSLADFVMLMNRRAAQLGMADTCFETPSGLDGQNHYSTARDMALLARAALQNEDFAAICSQKSGKYCYGAPPYERWLKNHNRLLSEYEGCIGVKTGFTKKAGRCLVSAAEREGITLICVTLNDPDDWKDHKALFNWGFSKIGQAETPELPKSLPVAGGEAAAVSLALSEERPAFLKEERVRLSWRLEAEPFCYAPIRAGETIGVVRWFLDGQECFSEPVKAVETVEAEETEKQSVWEGLRRWLAGLFGAL